MMTISLGHIVKVFPGLCRKDRLYGIESRRADGSRRETVVNIGIIGRINLRICDGQFFLLASQGILDGCIDLERHTYFQTFQHDRCNRHLVFFETGFPFHHGSQGHEIMQRQILCFRLFPDFRS